MADVPVSMEIFTKYFFDEIEQQSKTTLSVKKFLDDIATRIIRKALSGHNDVESPFLASNIQIRTLNITGPNAKKLSGSKVEVDIDDLPDFIKRTSPKRRTDETEYYINNRVRHFRPCRRFTRGYQEWYIPLSCWKEQGHAKINRIQQTRRQGKEGGSDARVGISV